MRAPRVHLILYLVLILISKILFDRIIYIFIDIWFIFADVNHIQCVRGEGVGVYVCYPYWLET